MKKAFVIEENIIKSRTRAVLLSSFLCVGSVVPMFAQRTAPTLKPPPPPPTAQPIIQPSPQLRALVSRQDEFPEKVNRRTPIAFKAFTLTDPQGNPLVDPRNRQVITRQTVLTLPNRKQITAGEYIDTLNALEERYSSIGYSLRERKSKTSRVAIEQVAVERTTLESQRNRLAAVTAQVSAPALNSATAIQNAKTVHSSVLRRRSETGATQWAALPTNVAVLPEHPGFVRDWRLEMGDPNAFYINLNGRFELQGSADSTTFFAQGRADSEVIQKDINLVDIRARAVSPRSQPLTLSLDLNILGSDVWSLEDSQITGYEMEGSKDAEVRWGWEWPFQVGPVPMSAELGVGGRAGINYYVAALPLSITGVVTPFTQTYAYAQLAAVEVQVAEAGVEGRLTLLNDSLVLMGTVQALADEQQNWYLSSEWAGFNQMESLSGKLGLYACVWVPGDGWKVWDPEEDCTYKWLWDWEGFTQGDYLFSGSRKSYL